MDTEPINNQVVGNGFCSSVVEHWSSNLEDAGSIPSRKALEFHFSQLVPIWVLDRPVAKGVGRKKLPFPPRKILAPLENVWEALRPSLNFELFICRI